MSRRPTLGVAAWRWIALAATVLAVAAIGFVVLHQDDPAVAPASAPAAPCTDTNHRQQVVDGGKADSAAVARTDLSPMPGLGLEPHGVCLDTADELYTRGWVVTSVDMAAQQGNLRWAATVDSENTTPLYVPLTGCVHTSWVYHLRGPDGVTGTWTVKDVLGVRCARYYSEKH